MHIKSLKIFCDTVTLRSFSKAANTNGVSQSNASHVVHQLEERLGVQLIDRSTRPFGITAEGQRYYDGCRGIVRRYADLEDEIRSLGEAAATRLTVSAIFSIGFGHMNQCLQAFHDDNPGVEVRMEYFHPPRVYAAVESSEADLGIVGHAEPSRRLGVIPWREERLAIVTPPGHRFAGQASVDLGELADERMIAIERGLKLREAVDGELARRGVEPRVVAAFDNIETVKRAIEAGEGISILPEPTIAHETASGTLASVPIKGKKLVRPLGILFRRDEGMSDAAEQFIAHLRRCADQGAAANRVAETASS